jgi:uncharacterized membrane protein YdjX (TVP38/TMEM64 family)
MDSLFTGLAGALPALGPAAWIVAFLVMVVVAVLPIPAELPALANGAVFGPVAGTLITWAGGMTGAVASFEIARRWGRPLAERFVPPRALRRVDGVLEGVGPGGLLLARLTPVIAFTALNWGAGLARLPRGRFLWTTALGILPGAIVFTASGTGRRVRWGRPSRWLRVWCGAPCGSGGARSAARTPLVRAHGQNVASSLSAATQPATGSPSWSAATRGTSATIRRGRIGRGF